MTFKILGRKTVFEGHVFHLENLEVRLPNGRTTVYNLVTHPGAVTLVPVDDDGNILFVRQFRMGAEAELLELPAGTLEPPEPPDETAARELREETGMAARRIDELGRFFLAPGYSSEYQYIYLARDLYPAPLSQDDDEFVRVERIPIAEAYHMAHTGLINDAKSLAALLLAEERLLPPA